MGLATELVDLFERWGGDPYDEDLGQLDHALQCAALADHDGAPDALVAAALCHDVGHLLALAAGRPPAFGDHGGGDDRHEVTGARWLAKHFPATVWRPVALHVAAKRYLCAIEPAYASQLSPASRRSLAHQGGPLTPDAARRFTAVPGATEAVVVRRWDDLAKQVGAAVPPLDDVVRRVARLAERGAG